MLNTTAPESQPSTRSTPTSQPPSQSSNSASPTAESKRPKRQHPKGGDQPPSEHQRSPPRHNQGRDRQPGAPSDVSSPQRQHQRVNQKLPFRADPVPQHSPSSRTPTTPASASARDASKDAVRAVTNTPKSKSKRNSAYSSSQPPTYQHHAGDGAEDSMAPSKFITIADPIDPVRIVKGKSGAIEVVNGCDLYVDWVERSLKAFDQVVLIGIDPAIANVVSIVNILEQSGMGGHHDLETFTSEESIGIQFKLHRGPVLENEMAQSRSLHRALSGPVGLS